MKCKATVKTVEYESIAYDCGIEPGDIIDNVDGKKFKDILDFKYLTSEEYYVVGVYKKDGTYEEIEIYNDCYEQFGVEFENAIIDSPMRCRNTPSSAATAWSANMWATASAASSTRRRRYPTSARPDTVSACCAV